MREAGPLDGVVDGVDVVVGGGGDGHRDRPSSGVARSRRRRWRRGGRRTGRRRCGRGPRRRPSARGLPARSCREAAASHRSVKRWRRASSWTRPVAHSSANRPPRPTAWSWRGSPTSASRQPLAVGEVDEAVQGGGADHAGLVDDQRRADREPIGVERTPVGPVPFVEQLGDGVGGHAGVSLQDTGRLGRRGDTEHGPVPRRQVVDGPFEHGGLAGAGRSHDEDEPVGAGDGGGGVGLQDVQAGPDDRR